MDNKKFASFLGAAVAFSLFVTGCSSSTATNSSDTSNSSISSDSKELSSNTNSEITSLSNISSDISDKISDVFSDRDLSASYDTVNATITLKGSTVEIDGNGATANGSVVTITDEGTYLISGTLDDGQIIVDSEAKVQLVLDNAAITCSDSSPIYIINADKTFITMADGSENNLTDGSSYTYDDETENEPDAVIFSKDSLTLNGNGTLNISANFNEGITGKDDVIIANCSININSIGNSIKGKDYVAVTNAELNIVSQADGVKSTNSEDAGMGFVYFESGTVNITAQEDGIQAETEFIAQDGTFNITAGGGSEAAEPKQDNDFGQRGGFNQSSNTTTSDEDSISQNGIKGVTAVYICGGTFNINSADDSLHSNANIMIAGGDFSLASGDDGIHADFQIDITGGNVIISESYEGIEAAIINVTGGTIEVKSSDDGFNASDGSDQGAMGSYASACQLNISGGTVYVDADGDGLDSNGDMTLSGGTILINGPTNDGNGALDGNNEIVCTGGLLIAAGSSGMAEYPGDSSSQHSVSITLDAYQDAGTLVTLCDESGNEIASFAPSKKFNSIIISSPDIKDGETYYIYTGGSSSSEVKYGLYVNGGYKNDGSEAGSFTADSITSFIGTQNSMGGGFGGGGNFGGGGFGGGNFGGDRELTTDENGDVQMPDGQSGRGRGGFGGGDFEMPTDENGDIQMPEGGGFPGGDMKEPPTGEDGMPEMPEGGFNWNSSQESDTIS